MNQDNYKTQIEDFRNLKPYYDLVFENMSSLSKFSFQRDYQMMTDALRELITNAPDYIVIKWEDKELGAEEILDLIEKQYSTLFSKQFYIDGQMKSLSRAEDLEFEKLKDTYLKFSRTLRIRINASFTKSGFLPKMDKVRQKNQSPNTKGSSV